MALTVYNGGFGLVKDVRTLTLAAGVQTIPVPDVAGRIEPDSVAIRSLSAPNSFSVLEQNYRFDLITPTAILQKAIGAKVTLVTTLPDGKVERTEGTLLSAPIGEGSLAGVVIRTTNGRVILNPVGTIEVESIPKDLVSKPTLFWDLNATKAGPNTVELSYITGGISWTANYVLLLTDEGDSGDLKGWVTMNNQSGASYQNCRLKLLAGEVNRAPVPATSRGGLVKEELKLMDFSAGMSEEQFGEYHLYTLPRPATVLNNEMKQLSLLEAQGIKLQKLIIFDPMQNYNGYSAGEGEVGSGTMKPLVQYKITNSKAARLGMPLPAGKFKIYQRDSEGATQLVGEDAIDHTATDETIKIAVGRAFDIVGERKRTSFSYILDKGKRIGAKETFVTELRNRKKSAESVELIERFWGDWKVVEASEPYMKMSAEAIQFSIKLKAGEVRKVTYTVENRWGR